MVLYDALDHDRRHRLVGGLVPVPDDIDQHVPGAEAPAPDLLGRAAPADLRLDALFGDAVPEHPEHLFAAGGASRRAEADLYFDGQIAHSLWSRSATDSRGTPRVRIP